MAIRDTTQGSSCQFVQGCTSPMHQGMCVEIAMYCCEADTGNTGGKIWGTSGIGAPTASESVRVGSNKYCRWAPDVHESETASVTLAIHRSQAPGLRASYMRPWCEVKSQARIAGYK